MFSVGKRRTWEQGPFEMGGYFYWEKDDDCEKEDEEKE